MLRSFQRKGRTLADPNLYTIFHGPESVLLYRCKSSATKKKSYTQFQNSPLSDPFVHAELGFEVAAVGCFLLDFELARELGVELARELAFDCLLLGGLENALAARTQS